MARDARPSAAAMVGRPSGMLTLTPADPEAAAGGAAAAACACAAACADRVSAVAALRILLRSVRSLASLAELVLRALRLAARLAQQLLRLPDFALEALQLALKPVNLTLNSFDPVNRSILRICHGRHYGSTERNHCAAATSAAATHAPPLPPFATKHAGNLSPGEDICEERETSTESRLCSRGTLRGRKRHQAESAPLDRLVTRRHLAQTRGVPLRGDSQHWLSAGAFPTRYRYFVLKGAENL